MITGLQIVEEARSWIGTPFYPHACKKGVGADCVQFARGVFEAVGLLPTGTEFPKYSLSGGEHIQCSIVRTWLEASEQFTEWRSEPEPGDVVTFHIGRVEHHVGIIVSRKTFVHCIRRYGVIESLFGDNTWKSRLRSVWRPRL